MGDIRQFFMKKMGRMDAISSEGEIDKRPTLSLETPNDKLAKIIDERISNELKRKGEIDRVNEINEKFYLGNQLIDGKGTPFNIFDGEARVVDNRIFLSIDTIVPILATKKREPIVIASQDTEESRELALLSQDFLSWKWKKEQMHLKLAELIRFFNIYRLSCLKYRYVPAKDDFIVELVRPESLIVDDSPEPEFIAEIKEDSVKNIISTFELDEERTKELLKTLKISNKELGTIAAFIEFWTDDFVVWKIKDFILDKKPNPNYLWKKNAYNFFDRPQKPYILYNWNTLSKSIYAQTTSLEQAIPIQRNINKRKRQISINADQASGTWIFNTKYLPKTQVEKFTGAANQHLYFEADEGTNINEVATRLVPKDLGNQVFAELNEDKAEVDNIFGVHSTTRGERGFSKTAREATLLKESDLGRLDLMSQYIDIKTEELYDAFIQMALVFYDEKKTLRILGQNKNKKFLEFSRDNIKEGMEIIIVSEPLLAKSEEINKYTMLYQVGAIDPLTMYEKLNLPNAKELARRSVLYQKDPMAYLAEFSIDENTEGFENDPKNVAKMDIEKLSQGEPVPPTREVTAEHLAVHNKFLAQDAFKNLPPEVQELMIGHVRQEAETAKQMSSQIK